MLNPPTADQHDGNNSWKMLIPIVSGKHDGEGKVLRFRIESGMTTVKLQKK